MKGHTAGDRKRGRWLWGGGGGGRWRFPGWLRPPPLAGVLLRQHGDGFLCRGWGRGEKRLGSRLRLSPCRGSVSVTPGPATPALGAGLEWSRGSRRPGSKCPGPSPGNGLALPGGAVVRAGPLLRGLWRGRPQCQRGGPQAHLSVSAVIVPRAGPLFLGCDDASG